MLKAVLLIEVNQFTSGLSLRQAAAQEAETIRRLLRHPILKGFSAKSMSTLKDPSRQGLVEGIGRLFRDRRQDQLLILILSDNALKDPVYQPPTSPCETPHHSGNKTGQKTNRTVPGSFSGSLAIAASNVHTLIDQSLSNSQDSPPDKEQSSAFRQLDALDAEPLDVRTQLDGENWTIITSSPPSISPLNKHAEAAHSPKLDAPLWRRPAMMLGVSAFFMVTLALGSSYALLQTRENTQAKESLEKAQAMQSKSDYAACIDAARTIPSNASTYLAAQTLLKTCEIGQGITVLISQENYSSCIEQAKSIPAFQSLLNLCKREQENRMRLDKDQQLWNTAQQLALSHNLKDAVTHLGQISPQSPVHSEAQALINRWSDQLLKQAANTYTDGGYENAIALAQSIPASSLHYQHAQETIDHWQKEWEANTHQLAAAHQALEVGRWREAVSAAEMVNSTSNYWRLQVAQIINQAENRLLEDARKAEEKKCQQYHTDYLQGVVDVMTEVGPKGGAIREKCAELGVAIADAY
ncbi:MAG: hypothetical protein QNJ46_26430 [Leptolyngbyaceae cyanobacterium MO_188.B28]|nr:hypothetical protein [Leptolyngbyaceae cyanobacterium MO_188.B28]